MLQKGKKGLVAFFLVLIIISRIKGQEENIKQKEFKQKGLGLEETITKKVRKKEVSNYHLEEMICADCHDSKPVAGKDKRETVKLVDEDINSLCNKCHEGDNLHPVSVNLNDTNKKVPIFLPLGVRSKNKEKITCTTCHAVHKKDAYNYLLRGFSVRNTEEGESILESEQGIFFKEREELCQGCHDKAFLEKSPHNREIINCKFCHIKGVEEAKSVDETFNKDISKLCNFCHGKQREAHYLSVNPFYDKELKKEVVDKKIVLIDGKIVCVSCHDPHGGSKLPHSLRENYVELAEKSKRINPHFRGIFCLACHEKNEENKKLGFKLDGDYNKICNWCHSSKEARENLHPIDIIPSKKENLKIPKEFPLQEGRITCITCHDAGKQEKNNFKEKENNPNFLRGTIYKDKNEMCFQCHIQNKFKKNNVHDQITDEGEIKEDNCVYCHTSRPGRDVEGLEDIDPTIEDLSYLCIRCHDNIPHPAKINHLVKMSDEKNKRKHQYESINNVLYPLDARNIVFCGTCHNVHESGIVKSNRASKGADASSRVRLPLDKGELCMVCHNKDKDKDKNENENEELYKN